MYRDSLGNTYAGPPPRPPVHTAKSASGGTKKFRRSKREKNAWCKKVKSREAQHAARGQKFVRYPC